MEAMVTTATVTLTKSEIEWLIWLDEHNGFCDSVAVRVRKKLDEAKAAASEEWGGWLSDDPGQGEPPLGEG
jgi:hypothetical protein